MKGIDVRVIQVRLEGCDGPCIHKTISDAMAEIESLCTDGAVGDKITVSIAEMAEATVDALPEFGGY